MIKCGPYTTVGTYETYVGGMTFSTVDLIITGTIDVTLEYSSGGVWTGYAGIANATASTTGAQLYAIDKVRVIVNSVAGGTATAYFSGLQDSQ